jgi:hypothetical protein
MDRRQIDDHIELPNLRDEARSMIPEVLDRAVIAHCFSETARFSCGAGYEFSSHADARPEIAIGLVISSKLNWRVNIGSLRPIEIGESRLQSVFVHDSGMGVALPPNSLLSRHRARSLATTQHFQRSDQKAKEYQLLTATGEE